MLQPVFTLNLNHKILPNRVTIGKYDGVHPCITAATASDKIFVHNPHSRTVKLGGRWQNSSVNSDINLLNINQSISAVTAGILKMGLAQDMLLVGTPTSLLVYDVDNNADLFYREVTDGANCVVVGKLGNNEKIYAFVGGNCSIQGYDQDGNDAYWTVTGDNVSAMTLCDFNEDGMNELIVGSEDFDIRVFKNDAIIAEMTETEAVTGLCSVIDNYFGYALANGTVGAYKQSERAWRIKSKNQAVSVSSYDLDGDGIPELITGWSNGKLDARSVESGEVIFKDNFSHCISGIVKGDYCLDGKEELIICAADGEVRGYLLASAEVRRQFQDVNYEQDIIRDLSQRKQSLMLEIRNYEENTKVANDGVRSLGQPSGEIDQYGMIPANTQLKTGLALVTTSDKMPPHVEIALQTSNNTVIRTVIIFAEGIFEGESHVVHPKESEINSCLRIPLLPPRDAPCTLHIKAMVGYKGSIHYHVFEVTRELPRFSMYSLCTEVPNNMPDGYVKFKIHDPVAKVGLWMNQNFLLIDDLSNKESLDFTFISLRTSEPVGIDVTMIGEVTIKTEDIEVAADIVQSLAQFLGIEDLHATAHFPKEISKLQELITKVEELQAVRQRLSADTADNLGNIRGLVVRAEDARLMADFKSMKKRYQELQGFNGELINNYKIRVTNHDDLMACLKQVNQVIQRAGRLRVGRPKTQVINLCRSAIKDNNFEYLVKIICMGDA